MTKETTTTLQVNKLARRIRHLKNFSRMSLLKSTFGHLRRAVAVPTKRFLSLKYVRLMAGVVLSTKSLISGLLPSSPQKRLLSIPGVGPKTVAAFLGEVGGDVTRFSSANKLIGFIGWYPRISESGESKNLHPKMSKKGPSALRASLYMAAVASLKHNPYLRSVYHRKISEGKESKQALISVGKKIISIMYSMLKYEADYDPQRIFFQFEKEPVLS